MGSASPESAPRLTTARNGSPSLVHQGLYLHSAYDPRKEADTWVRSQETGERSLADVLWVVFGCGLGYHLEALRAAGAQQILAFEPFESLPALRRQAGILSPPLEAGVADSLPALRRAFREKYPDAEATRIVSLPAYAKLAPELLSQLKAEIDGDVAELKDALYTHLTQSNRWVSQVMDNLPEVARRPSIFSLEGFARGWPAVVVSPGPSLEKALDTLSTLADRCLLLCTSQALRALCRRGIRPHFVVVADHQDLAYHFRDCPEASYANQILLSKCHPALLALPASRRFFHSEPTDSLTQQVFALRGEKPFVLEDGYSVSTLAFKLAVFMEADPLILVGQDLAFSGEKMYADAAVDGGRALEYLPGGREVSIHKVKTGADAPPANPGALRPLSVVWVPGQGGQPLPTYQSYLTMHHWFERQAGELAGRRRLVNASEGGALIRGMEHLAAAEIGAELSGAPPIEFSARLQAVPEIDEAQRGMVKRGLARKVAAYRELTALASRCEKLSGRCLASPGDERSLRSMLRSQRELTDGLAAHPEVDLWLQSVVLEHHRLEVGDADPRVADLTRARHLFRCVLEATGEMAPLLEKAVSGLSISSR